MPNHPQIAAALTGLADALPAYCEAEAFYDGIVDEIFFSAKLRRLFKDSGKKLRINYARTPVDVLTERTTIQGITVTDQSQQKLLDQAWEDNELGIEAKDVHHRAYEFGDSYLIGWPNEDRTAYPSGVEAYCHDPKGVRVFYDPEQPRRKIAAVHAWEETGDLDNALGVGIWHRVNLYYPDRVEQWVSRIPIVDSLGYRREVMTTDDYDEYEDETGAWPIVNPFPGVIPVFHFRTGRPYGRPEHADAYGPQNGINKLVTSLFGAVDHQVLPQRYIQEDDVQDAKFAPPPDSLTYDDELVPVTERVSSTAPQRHNLGSDPGDVWLLSGTKQNGVGQFPAADTKNMLDPILALVQAMADVTDMPANRYHRGGQTPSADSQRMDEAPLRAKTGDRHAQFGVTWHEFFEYVCLVNGAGPTDAQVAWAPPETYNDKTSWEAALIQLQAGVPFDQVMRERGYSTDVIEEWESHISVQALASVPVVEEPSTPE